MPVFSALIVAPKPRGQQRTNEGNFVDELPRWICAISATKNMPAALHEHYFYWIINALSKSAAFAISRRTIGNETATRRVSGREATSDYSARAVQQMTGDGLMAVVPCYASFPRNKNTQIPDMRARKIKLEGNYKIICTSWIGIFYCEKLRNFRWKINLDRDSLGAKENSAIVQQQMEWNIII